MQHQSSKDYLLTRKKRKYKKNERMTLEGRRGLKWACKGFLRPKFLLPEAPSWKWYRRTQVLFFSIFFFKPMLLGSCKSWTESMKSGSLKKGTKPTQRALSSPPPPRQERHTKKQKTFRLLLIVSDFTHEGHYTTSEHFFFLDLEAKTAYQSLSWVLSQ